MKCDKLWTRTIKTCKLLLWCSCWQSTTQHTVCALNTRRFCFLCRKVNNTDKPYFVLFRQMNQSKEKYILSSLLEGMIIFWKKWTNVDALCGRNMAYLIFVHIFSKFFFTQFIEGYNHKGHKNVDKEEGEDNKIYNVKDCHVSAKPWNGAFIFICRRHGRL